MENVGDRGTFDGGGGWGMALRTQLRTEAMSERNGSLLCSPQLSWLSDEVGKANRVDLK